MQDNFTDHELDRQNYTSAIFRARYVKDLRVVEIPKFVKVIVICILILIALSLVTTALVYIFSMPLSLMRIGIAPTAEQAILSASSADELGNPQSRLIRTTTADGEPAIVRMQKQAGLWRVTNYAILNSGQSFSSAFWRTNANTQTYGDTSRIEESAFNYLIIGNDAICRIDIDPNTLPENSLVNIWQEDAFYIVHVTNIGTERPDISLHEVLHENRCVPKK